LPPKLAGITGGTFCARFITDVTDAKSRNCGLGMTGAPLPGFIITRCGLLSGISYSVLRCRSGVIVYQFAAVAFWCLSLTPKASQLTKETPFSLNALKAPTSAHGPC
jgi:hypothetical protein